jgi:hypothetical protein
MNSPFDILKKKPSTWQCNLDTRGVSVPSRRSKDLLETSSQKPLVGD